MTTGTVAFSAFTLFLVGVVSFATGKQMQYWDMKLAAVSHECAHYDQRTAAFTWGPPNDASLGALPEEFKLQSKGAKK